MAIKKMKLVRVSGPLSNLNKLIRLCCSEGDFHVENADKFISGSMGYSSLNETNPYQKTLHSIREIFKEYSFDEENLTSDKKVFVDESATEYIEQLSRKLEKLHSGRTLLTDQYNECVKALEKYSHFKGLEVNLDEITSCEFISARFGHLPKEGYHKLSRAYADNPYILFCPCSADDEGYWGIYFAPTHKIDEIDRIFASLHYEQLTVPGAAGTTDQIITNIKENLEIINEEKKKLEEKIEKIFSDERDKLTAIYLKLCEMEKIFELRRYAVCHEDNCFFVGWIEAAREKSFTAKMSKHPEFLVEIEAPDKHSDINVPVKLKNTIFSRPYNFFVEMYGLPSYYDIDITGFVAFTYTLLFGIMFGDMGQGLVLILAGLIAWKKMNMALGKILVPCGISSVVFGFVFGSVFGFEHALDPVYEKLGMGEKPLEVMDSINTVLLIAIGIGVALVITAMLISVITNIKRGRLGQALFSQNGLTGIIVYIGGANLAYGFMAKAPLFSTKISVIMLVVGLLLLFNKEILCEAIDERKLHKPESMTDYILQNLFECIEYILSYFSNTVSFLRVGAFVIVHASMMMVVFTLAGDTSSVKGIIVVILGNILVIALEGLLTGIQGLRLEFYEMFSRFYEGEGKPFIGAKLK